ncbi:unnamed protein product [Rhizophagus irregularis]|nr:unnamed protein product [Rhizophagus irregularis]
MPDDSDDDGYGGYNEYGERDRVEPEGSSNQDRLILNNEIASEDPGTFMFCNDHSGSLVYGKQDSLGFFSSNISRSEHEEITSHFALHSLQSITMASEPLSTTIASEPSTSTSEIQTDTSEPSQLKCMGGNNIRVIVGVPVTEQPVTGRIGSLTTGISRLQLQDQRLWIRYNDERVSLPENILELLRVFNVGDLKAQLKTQLKIKGDIAIRSGSDSLEESKLVTELFNTEDNAYEITVEGNDNEGEEKEYGSNIENIETNPSAEQ